MEKRKMRPHEFKIPEKANRAIRETRREASQHEKYRQLADHLRKLEADNTIPPFAFGMSKWPAWLPDSKEFQTKFYDLKHNQARMCMIKIAEWLDSEADDLADDARTSMNTVTHHFNKGDADVDECKAMIARQVNRSVQVRGKTLQQVEGKFADNPVTVDDLVTATIRPKPKVPQLDDSRPLVFKENVKHEMDEMSEAELKKIRNRASNLRRRQKDKELRRLFRDGQISGNVASDQTTPSQSPERGSSQKSPPKTMVGTPVNPTALDEDDNPLEGTSNQYENVLSVTVTGSDRKAVLQQKKKKSRTDEGNHSENRKVALKKKAKDTTRKDSKQSKKQRQTSQLASVLSKALSKALRDELL